MKPFTGFFLAFIFINQLNAQKIIEKSAMENCIAVLKEDTLTLSNNLISRKYKWNEGNIISLSLEDKASKYIWKLDGKKPDCSLPGLPEKGARGKLELKQIEGNSITPPHLRAEVFTLLGTLAVKRLFRIYPDCPAIACDYYVQGKVDSSWKISSTSLGDLKNIENKTAEKEGMAKSTVIERLSLPGKHWKLSAIEFVDITDRNNTLVREAPALSFTRELKLKGNLLFANNLLEKKGIFILKESPASEVQLHYPGYDFITQTGEFQVTGIGIDPSEIQMNTWTKCYGFVTGVHDGTVLGQISSLRKYQEKVRIHKTGRDEMIMMNTWGDRAKDSRINEKFTLEELKLGAKLGISHFQLDDGWQEGRSANSAFSGGSFVNIWRNPDYWKPHHERFPNGLKPVVDLGKQLGIEVCLWFNPSNDSSFKYWRKDAEAMIKLYKDYGVRTFKIDGLMVADKESDINIRKMFDTLQLATNNEAVINLDVTAGKRFGYHYFNEYGNIFLENRYTDWTNYYPHWTLRNLWMLSKYIPAQNLQIEFLNKWRNQDKYEKEDKLAPSAVPFDYIFAVSMMAQPLAWMEAANLPGEAYQVSPLIKKYKSLQHRIQEGQIFPIGSEPSGTDWTGFQSMNGNKGYFLIFREKNLKSEAAIKTWLKEGKKLNCKIILGEGKDFQSTTGEDGKVKFNLPKENSFALYEYSLK